MWLSHDPKLVAIETYPVPAEMPSLNQKSQSAISPSQNTGADTKNSASPMESRSTSVRRLTADTMPMGMPMQTHTSAAPMASCAVTAMRSSSSERTGDRVAKEKPRPGQPY